MCRGGASAPGHRVSPAAQDRIVLVDQIEPQNNETLRNPDAIRTPANGADREYGADKIKVLEGLEAVRKRPGDVHRSTGPTGLHHLVYEVVDNSIDEALAGFCDQVNVTIHIDNSVTVVDNGRGIPVDMHETGKSAAEVVMTVLHAGGKFDNDAYKVSGGLHGVGVSVVNALSESLRPRDLARRPGLPAELRAREADHRACVIAGTHQAPGTKIRFKPDAHVFETIEFSFDTLANRLRELAFLNGGVVITLDDERGRKDARAKASHVPLRGRHREFVEHLNKNKAVVNDAPIFMQGTEGPHRRRDRDAVERRLRRKRSTASPTTSTRMKAARTVRASARR